MTFKALECPGRWYGALAALIIVLVDLLLVRGIVGRPVDGLAFIAGVLVLGSLLVVAYLVMRTFSTFTLEYWVDRDAVTLVWGLTRQVIPIGEIHRLVLDSTAEPRRGPRLWHWPCPHRRRLVTDGLGVVNAYATRPLAEQIVLVTGGESYGLSPEDPEAFLTALRERHALGVARPLQAELHRPPVWTWPLWRDRVAIALIGLGLLGVLLMFGVLCFRFPALSEELPLHFDVSGYPDRIAPKSGLFVLPMIGLLTWGFDLIAGIWLYRHVQQGAAYLLWGGAVAVQLIAGLALFNLMRW